MNLPQCLVLCIVAYAWRERGRKTMVFVGCVAILTYVVAVLVVQ